MESRIPGIKTVMLGDCGVGKTCLLKRFLQGTFNPDEESTVGAQYEKWEFQTAEGESVCFNFWDTAGQEQHRAIVPSYCKQADVAFICYSIDSRASFEALAFWRDLLFEQSPTARIVMVATKGDLRDELAGEVIPQSEAHEKAFEFGTQIISTSAKKGEGILELKSFLKDLPLVLAPVQEPSEQPAGERSCC